MTSPARDRHPPTSKKTARSVREATTKQAVPEMARHTELVRPTGCERRR